MTSPFCWLVNAATDIIACQVWVERKPYVSVSRSANQRMPRTPAGAGVSVESGEIKFDRFGVLRANNWIANTR